MKYLFPAILLVLGSCLILAGLVAAVVFANTSDETALFVVCLCSSGACGLGFLSGWLAAKAHGTTVIFTKDPILP